MSDSSRTQLAGLLSEAIGTGAFTAGATAPTADLQLEVRGVGPIAFPVTQAQAKQLCMIARPAHHGQGERTVLDRRVRDTWEVPKSRVKIDKRRFNRTLQPVLDGIRDDLGLPADRPLRAELHSMLVYAPGQFFLEHQDSEKDDAMIGTLVLGLPSNFAGGALQIRHRGQTVTYRGSKRALSFAAFYGDCRHEVRPVTSGYRVVLTYNLLVNGDGGAGLGDRLDPGLVDALAGCLDEYFASADGGDRLIYMLDHEYTRSGLDRSRLKGADAQRAALLAAAAQRADCALTLGLMNVHETWSAYDTDERAYYRDRWDDESDSAQGADGEYELEELIDWDSTLDSWIDPRDGIVKEVGLSVNDWELCESTPSRELEPYESEYEGYMGNWGNTLDRWYHRGALVVWPQGLTFAVQAEIDPAFALDELATLAESRGPAAARVAAATLASFWGAAISRSQTTEILADALRVGHQIDDPELAAMLLKPFSVELLGPRQAKMVSALVDCYGIPWAQELVAAWTDQWHGYSADSVEAWVIPMPELCSAFKEAGDGGVAVARLLIYETWKWWRDRIDPALSQTPPSVRDKGLTALAAPLASILEASSLIGAVGLRDEALALLCCNADLLGCAIATLKATAESGFSGAGLEALAVHGSTILATRLDTPPRRPGDWSIQLLPGCGCELCAELEEFLADPDRTEFGWPLAKDRRRHIHSRIDNAELPVSHATRRTGRPYTLVLTKTKALFEREAAQRRQNQQHFDWLEQYRRGAVEL